MQTRALTLALLAVTAVPALADQPLWGFVAHAAAYERGGLGWDPSFPTDSHHDGGDYAMGGEATGIIGNAQAMATGQLSQGQLHMGAWSTPPKPDDRGTSLAKAYADIDMWDTVTLSWSGATDAFVPFEVSFDGSYKNNGGAYLYYQGYGTTYFSGYLPQELYTVRDDITLTPLVNSVTFRVKVSAHVESFSFVDDEEESYANYMHTLNLKWDLPEGVTFTSASGVFNPQPLTKPIPEPAAFAPLGLGALVLLKRRRTR